MVLFSVPHIMKHWYHANIEQKTEQNSNFREVLYTSDHLQLVLMSLLPGEEIGLETHHENDQFFRVESGNGICVINETTYSLSSWSVLVIPAHAQHNISNTSSTESLKMYTIYTPPHHKDWIVRTTKQEAIDNEAEFDGKTTE